MNKKLLAVAVAGALTLPAVAFAQSSVVISGMIKGGFEQMKYGNYSRAAGNSNQSGVVDDSSRIIFNVREDLGGGLSAIFQADLRLGLDTGAIAATGNTHLGLQSKQWGRLFLGRQDLHYFGRESEMAVRGSLRSDSISMLAYVANPGGASQAIAGATRTPNVVHYTTPNWSGFSGIVAYSSNPGAAGEADIASNVRDGNAWNIAVNYEASNWTVGYSYWKSKNDAGGNTIATGDQRGDRLFGSYRWGGLKFGLAWDSSKVKGAGNGATLADRDVWSIPVSYSWGPHSVHFHYDWADKDGSASTTAGSVQNLNGNQSSKSEMLAISYGYDFSKRTSASVTYANIKNSAGANYNFFTNTSLGLANSSPLIGEDPKLLAVTVKHSF